MKKKILAVIIGSMVLALGLWQGNVLKRVEFKNEPEQNRVERLERDERLVIDFGNGEKIVAENLPAEGLSVYEVLVEVLKDREVELEIEEYDFGTLIKSINGKENTLDKAWIYFVNGESGSVAADKQVIAAGDEIEWRYISVTSN